MRTLRTICLVFVGDGSDINYIAIASMSRSSLIAIASNSASFSAASLCIYRAVLIYYGVIISPRPSFPSTPIHYRSFGAFINESIIEEPLLYEINCILLAFPLGPECLLVVKLIVAAN